MTRYLIDIRLMGAVRHQIRTLSDHLQEKFNLGDKLVVPHITLAGPFSTGDEKNSSKILRESVQTRKRSRNMMWEGMDFLMIHEWCMLPSPLMRT